MKRLPLLLLAAILTLTGCRNGENPPTPPGAPPAVPTPSAKPLPDEYRTLANALAMGMKSAPDQFRDDKDITEIMAEMHSAVLDLRGIQSSDEDIMYIADQAEAAFSEALLRLERINALPKPPGAEELFVSSFVDGFMGNFVGAYARGLDAEAKQNAIIAELYPLIAAIEKVDVMHQMLPKVAKKYSATYSDSTNRIAVDFDESWGWFGPHDWLNIYNYGPALHDCTIVVQLTGTNGEVRKNVHFLEQWRANTWMLARYEGGTELLEKHVGRTTVDDVQSLDVTIYSPTYATEIHYVYKGEEHEKDVAKYCEDLTFTGRYQPFESGILWDTQRGVEFTLDGVAWIPKCRVDVTFRKGSQSKTWHWELDGWRKGEKKSFSTSKGDLTFDPSHIDMYISFPGTIYTHRVTLSVNR